MDFRTADSVLQWLEKQVRAKEIIDAHTWVEACQYLNISSGEEADRLFDLQQIVALLKVAFIEQGDSVAMAKVKVEGMDAYKEMLHQQAKIKRIEESIRIAKIQARLKDSEIRNQ